MADDANRYPDSLENGARAATAELPPTAKLPRTAELPPLDPPRPRRHEPTLGLISGLARDVSTLVRQEAALVRAELAEKLEIAKAGVTAVATGALVTFAGSIFVLFAAVLALDERLKRPWLSALIVGGVVMLIGAALLGRGKSELRARNLVPERSKKSLQKDVDLAREEVGRAQ